MAENQRISIEMGGKADFLTPESLVTAVDSLVSLLKSVDGNMWRVAAPRYRWKVADVQMNSPLTLTLEATKTNLDAPDADVVGTTAKGLESLNAERPKRPRYFDSEGLAQAKRLVSVFRDSVNVCERQNVPASSVADDASRPECRNTN